MGPPDASTASERRQATDDRFCSARGEGTVPLERVFVFVVLLCFQAAAGKDCFSRWRAF